MATPWKKKGKKRKKTHYNVFSCSEMVTPKFYYYTAVSPIACFSMTSSKFKLMKSSILLSFYLLEQLKINIYSNFHFEKVLAFLLYGALEFLSFCVTQHLHSGLKSCHVDLKSDLFWRDFAICHCVRRSISSIITISPRDEFTFS